MNPTITITVLDNGWKVEYHGYYWRNLVFTDFDKLMKYLNAELAIYDLEKPQEVKQ